MSSFLLEIGLEEMPAHLVTAAIDQLADKTSDFLTDNRLTFEKIQKFSTPRRLALIVSNLDSQSQSIDEELRGPSLKAAKDQQNNWTKAAEGFAKSKGKSVDDFIERDGYLYLSNHVEGIKASEILKKIGADVIESMKFNTYMKWANYSLEFIRPIKWLVAKLDDQVIDFNILDIQSSDSTYGHRFLANQKIKIDDLNDYQKLLEDNFVIADAEARKELIVGQIQKIANDNNWQITVDQGLLEEVNNLVEFPTAFAGNFDEKYLELPQEVLVTSMREHQRFFYVTDDNQKILNHFISVRNGNDQNINNVVAGNEKVLVARLEDAEFFYAEDQKRTIDDYLASLQKLVFHEKIGSVVEHMQRTKQIANLIADQLNLDINRDNLNRAADIYKFDLMTDMVNEFSELQGVMGEHYAQLMGEDQQVAIAIKEHYMPTSAEGDLPDSDLGAVLAIADKLDSILSFFKAELIPTGSNDPYSLRRAAIGIVRITQAKNWSINFDNIIDQFDAPKVEILNFLTDRIKQLTDVERKDVVEAATSNIEQFDINQIFDRIDVLNAHLSDANISEVLESLTRVSRISKDNQLDQDIDQKLFENDYEKNLYLLTKDLKANNNLNDLFEQLANLQQPIAEYFDNTMVMAEDQKVKNNRLALLFKINQLISQFGDLEKIVIK